MLRAASAKNSPVSEAGTIFRQEFQTRSGLPRIKHQTPAAITVNSIKRANLHRINFRSRRYTRETVVRLRLMTNGRAVGSKFPSSRSAGASTKPKPGFRPNNPNVADVIIMRAYIVSQFSWGECDATQGFNLCVTQLSVFKTALWDQISSQFCRASWPV